MLASLLPFFLFCLFASLSFWLSCLALLYLSHLSALIRFSPVICSIEQSRAPKCKPACAFSFSLSLSPSLTSHGAIQSSEHYSIRSFWLFIGLFFCWLYFVDGMPKQCHECINRDCSIL